MTPKKHTHMLSWNSNKETSIVVFNSESCVKNSIKTTNDYTTIPRATIARLTKYVFFEKGQKKKIFFERPKKALQSAFDELSFAQS